MLFRVIPENVKVSALRNISVVAVVCFLGVVNPQMTFAQDSVVNIDSTETENQTESQMEKEAKHEIGDVIGRFTTSKSQVELTVNEHIHEIYLTDMYVPTYEVDEELYMVVEDLAYYGYTNLWNGEDRTSRLYVSGENMNLEGTRKAIKSAGYIYYTDIKTYVDGVEISGLNIGGYTLVKLSDLSEKAPNLRFEKRISDDSRLIIKGDLVLPEEVVNSNETLKVAPAFYYFNSGNLQKLVGEEVVIPSGHMTARYEMEIPFRETWNNMGYDNPNIYTYMGYELTDEENGYIKYDLTGSWETESIYLNKLDYYRDSYDQVDIKIMKERETEVVLNLEGDVFDAYGKGQNREIRIVATDIDTGKFITDIKRIGSDQKQVVYSLELIENINYRFEVTIKLSGGFTTHMLLESEPAFPTYYYASSGVATSPNLAQTVKVSEENKELIMNISLPNIIIGDVYEADKTINLGSNVIKGYKVNGKYLVRAAQLNVPNRTRAPFVNLDQFPTLEEDVLEDTNAEILGKLLVSSSWAIKEDSKINLYWFMYGEKREALLLVDDLSELGYIVKISSSDIKID